MLRSNTLLRSVSALCRRVDERVRRAFSRTAMQYDVYAGLQKEMGRQLADSLSDLEDVGCIVDVGCGTGRTAHRLALLFPEASVVGLDAAFGMCRVAREKWGSFPVVQADAADLPLRDAACDLLVSNLVYQWVDDFESVCREHHRILRPSGRWAFTMFIDGTLEELFRSLEACAPYPVRWPRFLTREEIIRMVTDTGFRLTEMKEEGWDMPFASCRDLLRWLKHIGAHTNRSGVPVSLAWVRAAQRHYDEHHRSRWGVTASFRVGWFNAVKKRGL